MTHLQNAARRIAGGEVKSHLTVASSIHEVKELARHLESMRDELVGANERLAREMLKRAASGAEALAEFEREPADVVITDIIMPKVHGIELIRSIRERSAATRIIAISGGGNFGPLGYEPGAITTQAYLASARKSGADEVLTKPFDAGDLLSVIQRVLGH